MTNKNLVLNDDELYDLIKIVKLGILNTVLTEKEKKKYNKILKIIEKK